MRVLIVEAPGVLYPIDHDPPTADPITSGLRFVRALTEGYGVSVLIVGQLPDDQLRAWLKTYDVTFTWTLTGKADLIPAEFWGKDVLSHIGKLRASPVAVITARTSVAHTLTEHGIPALCFYPPDGSTPDWPPVLSSWVNELEPVEE